MDLFLTFIGTSASVPTAARGTPAILIARGGARWLVDCGEGTQRQLLRSGLGLVDVDLILITHLHGDHYLGLPGLLKTYGLRGRERALVIAGPPGLVAMLETLRLVFGRLPYEVELLEVAPGILWRGEGARWEAFPTDHGMHHSFGYALVEDERPGAFDKEAALSLGVPEGPLFGQLQRGGEVVVDGHVVRPADVLGPARAGRRIVLSGDTRPCVATQEAARGADLLVHEATQLDGDRERAVETFHTTALEAGALARAAGVRLLALTHLSTRFGPREARREAEREFPRVVVPWDFDQVEVPFPERGEPMFHPAAERPSGRLAHSAASAEPATVTSDDL
jgi:ribonuclease Z